MSKLTLESQTKEMRHLPLALLREALSQGTAKKSELTAPVNFVCSQD
jgi:hypothetical protein